MKKLLNVIALASILIPTMASAELSYDSAQISQLTVSSSGNADLKMLNFAVSKGITSNVFLAGGYGTGSMASGTSLGDISFNGLSLVAGYHTPIQTNVDFIVSGGLAQATVKFAGLTFTGNGPIVEAGIRAEITPQFEGKLVGRYGSISFDSVTATTTGINAELGFKIVPQFQLFAGVGSFNTSANGSSSSSSAVEIGARLFY